LSGNHAHGRPRTVSTERAIDRARPLADSPTHNDAPAARVTVNAKREPSGDQVG
jgi:hypothetical protein